VVWPAVKVPPYLDDPALGHADDPAIVIVVGSVDDASDVTVPLHDSQVALFPGETQNEFTGNLGVFDFDGALFRTLWNTQPEDEFFDYVRYYISDHRPLWAEFRT
jgi:hypothetical protein